MLNVEGTERYYPVRSRPTWLELKVLGFHERFIIVSAMAEPFIPGKVGIVGVKTNDRRKPLRGEWFLYSNTQGVIKAGGYDYEQEYDIMRLIVIETKLRVIEVSFHRTKELTKV